MNIAHRLAPANWLRMPRRTARLRLAALYGMLFLVSGAALVAVTYVLFERATAISKPQLPKIPHTPSIQALQFPGYPLAPNLPNQLQVVQNQLAQTQHQLSASATAGPVGPLITQATHDQQTLNQDQHALAKSVHQLAQSVHQLAQAGTVQAAQRGADSHQLLVNSGIALAIVALLALLTGWIVAGRMLRPIRTITRTAREISSTNLHERLALDGPEDELKELGDTLDGLFGAPRSLFRGTTALRRQRLSRAAHSFDRRAHPPPGCPRRSRHHDRRMALHGQGGARLQR